MSPKPSKYRNRKTVVDGLTFDSAKEARRWSELFLLQRAGQITDLARQERINIMVNGQKVCAYIADFTYTEAGNKVVEDCKGYKTDIYRLKRKLLKAALGVEIRET